MSKKTEASVSTDPAIAQMRVEALSKSHSMVQGTIPVVLLILAAIRDWLWNPGKRSDNDYVNLIVSIKQVGLKKPVIISRKRDFSTEERSPIFAASLELVSDYYAAEKKTKVEIDKIADQLSNIRLLQGFVRASAIEAWFGEDKSEKAFKAMFPTGIPCMYIEGLAEAEEYYLACDHDTVTRSKIGLIEQGVKMFGDVRITENDVAVALWPEMMEVFNAIDPKKIEELTLITDMVKAASHMKKCRRGVIQRMAAFARKLPPKAYDMYKRGLTGEAGDVLKAGQIDELRTANAKGTMAKPTDEYLTIMEEFVAQNKTGTKAPSMMSKTATLTLYGQVQDEVSQGFATAFALGESTAWVPEVSAQLRKLIDKGTLKLPDTLTALVKSNEATMLKK